MLPAYSLLLGLLALVGFMGIAIGVSHDAAIRAGGLRRTATTSRCPRFHGDVPGLVRRRGVRGDRDRRSGAGGDHVDRDRQYLHAQHLPGVHQSGLHGSSRESQVAKIVSLIIKAGALVFIFFVPLQYALWLQLLGGVWIVQTAPSVIIGLYTRLFHGWALFFGWLAGIFPGTWMVLDNNYAPVYPLHILGRPFRATSRWRRWC